MMGLYQEMWTSKKVTGDDFCQCGSCRKHWQRYMMMSITAYPCSAKGCENRATVGGHIVAKIILKGILYRFVIHATNLMSRFRFYMVPFLFPLILA